jgi:hypothetical protein
LISEAERRIKILEYVRKPSEKDGKITKSDVMRHMKEVSRMMTTHKATIELIKEGKIRMTKPKDKPYSQIDYLVINDNNEFNKIYNILLEIENHIDSMDSFAAATRELKRRDKGDEYNAGHLLEINYRMPYESEIDSMLHFLLVKVSERHLNDQDSEILYRKITRLFQKLLSQRGFRDLKESTNLQLDVIASSSEHNIKKREKDFQKYAKIYDKYHLDFSVRDDLLKIRMDFKKEFLS